MDNRPIGFFDSGLGGISTLAQARKFLPGEDFIYYADSSSAPFGNRPEAEILAIAERAIAYLVGRGVKAIVIACNTATGIGAGRLRSEYDLDILGVEPAIKPAMERWSGRIVLSLSTHATAASGAFNNLVKRYAVGKPLIIKSMPHLAEDVEGHFFDRKTLRTRLAEELSEFTPLPIESVVLGCTHYVFVKDLIFELFAEKGKIVVLYDGNEGTARNLRRKLEAGDKLAERENGRVEIVSTDPEKLFLYRAVLAECKNKW